MELRPDHQFDRFGPYGDLLGPDADAYDGVDDNIINSIDWNDPSSFFKAMGAGAGGMPIPEMKSAPEIR